MSYASLVTSGVAEAEHVGLLIEGARDNYDNALNVRSGLERILAKLFQPATPSGVNEAVKEQPIFDLTTGGDRLSVVLGDCSKLLEDIRQYL